MYAPEEELRYRIALSFIKGIGDILAKKMLSQVKSAKAIFHLKNSEIKNLGLPENIVQNIKQHQNEALTRADKELNFIQQHNINVVTYTDPTYPFLLKETKYAPFILYQKGNFDLTEPKMIAIVGTRKATEYGKDVCQQIVKDLAAYDNVCIVSGLAYGIDIAAHKAAIDNNLPTICVLGHGLDRVYPASHKHIANDILNNGCWLSEFVSETLPDKENFPRRNRIIAGMSLATIVVEAAESGGALITTEMAFSYNRDVFAVPGRLTDKSSAGCNNLIKNNKAVLISSGHDVANFLMWNTAQPNNHQQTSLFPELTPEQEIIVQILKDKSIVHIDELAIESNMSMNALANELLTMELLGMIKSLPGKMFQGNF